MKQAINNINTYIKDNTTLVVAVSGGPDSMALLDILLKQKQKKNLNIVVAHVNHKLRQESDAEEIMVKNYCGKNHLTCEILTIDNYKKGNIENQARTKRYVFFEEIVKKRKASYLLTAHHGDDLIETIMMRIVRGSSPRGYSGFGVVTKKKGYQIIRPLINNTKKELEDYVKNHNITYAIDKTNFDKTYTRNRYRMNILPYLKEENPNVHNKFYKFSTILKEYDAYIEEETMQYLPEVTKGNTVIIEKFQKLKPLIQKRILSTMLMNIYGNQINCLNDKHLNMVLKLVNSHNQTIYLPHNIIAIKDYTKIYFTQNKKEKPKTYKIKLENKTILPNGHVIEKVKDKSTNSNYICRLNSKEIHMPIYIRTRKDGDKIVLKGLNKTKKVKDIFIDEKISLEKRNNIPIVTDSNDNILWIPGIKKSNFDKQITGNYDIILWYS